MSTVSTVQTLFPSPGDPAQSITSPASQAPLAWFTDQLGATDPALILPAPTIAQVSYWRDLCGVANGVGKQGVADDARPPDRAPSRSTLRALEERNLLVRRERAWHLRRNWYTRLGALRLRAVPTPPLEVLDAPGVGLPTF